MLDNSLFSFFAICLFVVSCQEPNQIKERPLIYEGMPSNELIEILGKPSNIDSSNKVFNAEERVMQKLEKWYFPNRTVLIINDTVKDPSL